MRELEACRGKAEERGGALQPSEEQIEYTTMLPALIDVVMTLRESTAMMNSPQVAAVHGGWVVEEGGRGQGACSSERRTVLIPKLPTTPYGTARFTGAFGRARAPSTATYPVETCGVPGLQRPLAALPSRRSTASREVLYMKEFDGLSAATWERVRLENGRDGERKP